MLTLIALSAVLMQEPPVRSAPPESRTRVVVVESDGLDKDGDGQVSREEFAAPLNDHFARIDKDGDGRLSTEEMAAGHGPGDDGVMIHHGPGAGHLELRRSGPPGVRSGSRTMVFAARGEGVARAHEFIVHDLIADGGARLFHMPHGPGPVDAAITVRLMGGPGDETDMDADKDGRLSEAEFTGPLREAFTRMDADHSGFIEEGERGQGHDVQVLTHRVETPQNRED